MRTPSPMNHMTDAYLLRRLSHALEQGCTTELAADRLGVEKHVAVEYYKRIMIENSIRAKHYYYGFVDVYFSEAWNACLIFKGGIFKDAEVLPLDTTKWEYWLGSPPVELLSKVAGSSPPTS